MKETDATVGEGVLAFLALSRQQLSCLRDRQIEAEWVPIRAAGTVREPGLNATSSQGHTG